MEDPRNRRERDEDTSAGATAARVEDWLRSLRLQRAGATEAGGRGSRSTAQGAAGGLGATAGGDDPVEAFLKAARRLAASPRAQEALARRLAASQGPDDPSLRALARVFEALGRELFGALGEPGRGTAATLERPDVTIERRLSDDEGGGGDDGYDDEGGGGGDGDDEEPWPSAFIGYRVGVVERVDVGTCREGCCTAVFMEHPGLRAAVWFPTETAGALAATLSELLENTKGETAELGVPPFAAGDPPGRGQVQAAIQFFTEDIHLDAVDAGSDRRQGGFARILAYDQGLGHGGPPLVDALIDITQARALRRALRRAARNFSKERD